jgi:signal peptidase I
MESIVAPDLPAGARDRLTPVGIVLRLTGAILAGLLVAAVVVALVATQLLGYHALGIASDSMDPALHRGDLVITRPVPITAVASGDVVAFDEGQLTQITVVHRVIGVVNVTVNTTDSQSGVRSSSTSRLLQTKGDGNPAPDGTPVSADRFRGLVFASVPGVGGILGSGQTQTVLVALPIVTAVLWLAYEIVRYRRRRSAPT